jgi:hypothetical protein
MPTPKQLDAMIQQQEIFVKQNLLVLALLCAYRRDPNNLTFIGEKLKKKCNFDEKYLDESFDEIACEAAHGNVGVAAAGGIFHVMTIVPKKKKATLDELIGFISISEFKEI